ncbi:AAA family ATPase [Ileibacterium valens]|uniref:AAA family ATPase n=1 Tax=Ileibacterium valens TaxID=1862668 RepID=UPI002729B400|nr:SMC family ATPase [Ileibacterium valens]
MKPIKLVMQSFGSYGGKTIIDFTKPNQELFLITGDTGAGKSTIFDAIVFALYGEGSSISNKKSAQEFKSRFGSASLEPYIELEFMDGMPGQQKTYIIKRSPAWNKPRVRNKEKGDILVNRKVDFYDLDGTFAESGVSADAKIEEIIGLNREQFMQVAMIAQNEFMQVLRASSQDKKAIFSRLFNTEKYARITDVLKDQLSEAKSNLKQIETSITSTLENCSFPETLINNFEALSIQQSLKEGRSQCSIVEIEQFQKDLSSIIKILEDEASQLKAQWMNAENQDRAIQKQIAQAKRLQEDFTNLNKAEASLEELKNHEKQMLDNEKLITKIPLSFRARARYDQANQIYKTLNETKARFEKMKEELPAAKENLKKASETYQECKMRTASMTEKCSLAIAKAQDCLNLFREIAQANQDKERVIQAYQNLKVQQSTLNQKLDEFEKKTEAAKNITETQTAEKIRRALLDTVCEDLNTLKKRFKKAQEISKEVEHTQEVLPKSKSQYQQAIQQFENLNLHYIEENRKFLDCQAGILALSLADDKPCPVCGSIHHPNPAKLDEDRSILSEKDLTSLQKKVESAQKKSMDLSLECQNGSQNLMNLQSKLQDELLEIDALLDKTSSLLLGEAVCLKLHQSRRDENQKILLETILLQLDEIEQEWTTADIHSNKQLKRIQNASTFLEKVGHEIEKINQDKEKIEADLLNAHVKIESLKTQIDEKRTRLSFPDEKEANQIIKDSKVAQITANQKEEEASNAVMSAQRQLSSCNENLKILTAQIPELDKQFQKEKTAYQSFVDEHPEIKDWQEIISQYSDEQTAVAACRSYVSNWKNQHAAASALYTTAKKNIQDQKMPDTENLEQKEKEVQEVKAQIEQKQRICLSALDMDKKAKDVLDKKIKEREKASLLSSRLDNLYTVLSGKKSGGKMDLETYVLRAYLREILKAANRRFVEMNGGQFELQMTDLETSDTGRKNRGLDLMVYSNVTGKTLPVNTLSGGESFMAALSMALGLADQIQQNSASLSLDMMFIDEGFGTLDDQTRSQAIRVLQDLTEKKRMIGIISHVSELKQEIEDKLIVKKTDHGSEASWQIS